MVTSSAKKANAMEQDFTPLLETKIPEYTALAQAGKVEDAVENLLLIEKQARVAEDAKATSKVATSIVHIIVDAGRWDYLNEKLLQLSKRRGQLKMAIKDMVEAAIDVLDKTPDEPTRLALIDTLRTITEGKIFVEVERARLTRMLAKTKEEKGDLAGAATILQEIQVETFGAMDKREKTEFLLEQVRLVIDNRDFIRAQILSNKIHRRVLLTDDMQDLKIRFYTEMIRYYLHERNFLEVCRSYQMIYDTPSVKANKLQATLKKIVLFIVLASFSPEQADLLQRIYEDKNLEELPMYRDLLKWFITKELVRWPVLMELYRGELTQTHASQFSKPAGASSSSSSSSSSSTSTSPSSSTGEPDLWEELKKRVVEHNLRVIAKYYSRISASRLSTLLDLQEEETEKFISDLVSQGIIYAKIDRPHSLVVFQRRQQPNEVLNEWSQNIGTLLDTLEQTTHLIHREIMVHAKKQ
eukprot:TRINITY_DN1722_c0_g2_i2.p1 TRINITY_DN1722_c0_g2~~TRINITY_DN1722_c0_g2_i2.p1  ORF type:complete len:478 (+),score=169.31 TRINITY_DN1722_c0_g2_i2:28-1434(+)